MITMRSTIDKAGRVVIPKPMRVRAGLEPGTPIEIRYDYGRIEIEAAPVPVKLVRKGGWLVIQPLEPVPPMPLDIVERTREAIERDRLEAALGHFLPDEFLTNK